MGMFPMVRHSLHSEGTAVVSLHWASRGLEPVVRCQSHKYTRAQSLTSTNLRETIIPEESKNIPNFRFFEYFALVVNIQG